MVVLGVCNGEVEHIDLYNAQIANNGVVVTDTLTQFPEGKVAFSCLFILVGSCL
jgi:hypothetical protein